MSFINSDLGAALENCTPESKLEKINYIITVFLEKCRLGLPILSESAIGLASCLDVSEVVSVGLAISREAHNATAYERIAQQIQELRAMGVDVKAPDVDMTILPELDKAAARRADDVEIKLSQADVTQIKHIIRAAVIEAVRYYILVGNYQIAIKVLTTHTKAFEEDNAFTNLYLLHAEIAMLAGSYASLQPIYVKLSSRPYTDDESSTKASIIDGLDKLRKRQFNAAAAVFSNVKPLPSSVGFPNVALQQDVALWAALSLLASQTSWHSFRSALRSEESQFREVIDTSSPARDILMAFDECNYSKGIQQLEKCVLSMEYDRHIACVIPDIIQNIKCRAITQFWSPFGSLRISTLEAATSINKKDLVAIVIQLITSEGIDGRLDLVDDVLLRGKRDLSLMTRLRTLQSGTHLIYAAQEMCLRMKLAQTGYLTPKN